jgi:hypothetical protein
MVLRPLSNNQPIHQLTQLAFHDYVTVLRVPGGPTFIILNKLLFLFIFLLLYYRLYNNYTLYKRVYLL